MAHKLRTRSTVYTLYYLQQPTAIYYEMQQRGSFSICTLILIALEQKPLCRTRIMQELSLSYSRTNKYLDILAKQGLTSYNVINHSYDITQKGRKILTLNRQLARYVSPINEMITKYSRFMKDDCYSHRTNDYFPEEKQYSLQDNVIAQI
jgi:predicted transcriptional regulator